MNPYSGLTFFEFFEQLFLRIFLFVKGGSLSIASDEVQILVLSTIAISGALVGTFLIYRRMTMLANSLSHTILIGIVIAFLITQSPLDLGSVNIQVMLIASLITAFATTFFTHFLVRTIGLQEDASIGIVFTSLFALGIILVTVFTRDAHIGAEVVMGNVDALHFNDLKLSSLVLMANVFLIVLFFKEYQVTTFDPGLSQALGISPLLFNSILMVQTAGTVVASFRAVGVLMVLAFITAPVLIARFYTHNLKTMLILAPLIGVLVSIVGVALSRHLLSFYGFPLSTGGLTVCLLTLFFAISMLKGYKKSVVTEPIVFLK